MFAFRSTDICISNYYILLKSERMKKIFSILTLFLLFIALGEPEEIVTVENELQTKSDLIGQASADPLVVGYFPSWSETYPSASGTKLRNMPEEVTHIFLSFIKPDMRYVKGSFDIKGVGIEVPYDGAELKKTVDVLKAKGTKVILSIGGETYWGTDAAYDIDFQQIADFVRDFGFDGIDWDYEPNGGFQTIGEPQNVERFIRMIRESRKLLPREEGYLIACAPAGCGALGRSTPYPANDDAESPYAYAKRAEATGDNLANEYNATAPEGYTISLYGFASTGHMIPVFKAVGQDLDFVAFQGYNTGSASQREIMYDSYAYYANIYGFRVAFGMHVPEEPWGPFFTYTETQLREYSAYVAEGGKHNLAVKGDGVMFWQLLQQSKVDPTLNGVDYCKIAYDILENHSPSTTPKVSIASPINNAMIRESDSFEFTANTKRVLRVDFFVDNVLLESSTSEPHKTTVKGLAVGEHTLKVVAFGANSERAEAEIAIKVISDNSVEDLPLWSAQTTYATSGTIVLYNSKVWSNKWWTQGDVPGESDVWAFVRNADGSGDNGNGDGDNGGNGGSGGGNEGGNEGGGDQGNGGGSTNPGDVTPYDPAKSYPTPGTIVTYNGKKYKSKWWVNAGEAPGNPAGPWELILENGEGTTPDKALEYNIEASYATPGTFVTYNGKTYTNKWYVSVGEYPGKDPWGPWEEVR